MTDPIPTMMRTNRYRKRGSVGHAPRVDFSAVAVEQRLQQLQQPTRHRQTTYSDHAEEASDSSTPTLPLTQQQPQDRQLQQAWIENKEGIKNASFSSSNVDEDTEVEVDLTMVDGNGVPLDCETILATGLPTLPAEVRAASDPSAAKAEAEAAAEVANGRDTNGSFDESVMLYQLCLEQQGGTQVNEEGGTVPPSGGPTATNGYYVVDSSSTITDSNASSGGDTAADSTTNHRPLKYLCTPTQTTRQTRGKFLSYAYDVHVRSPTHVLDATSGYEAKMAEYLATELGVDGCQVVDGEHWGVKSGGGRRDRHLLRRRSLQQQDSEGDVDAEVEVRSWDVVGISAEPRDMPDYDADCQNHYLGFPTSCYHMNGSLALYFRPDAPDEVVQEQSEAVLKLISDGMRSDRFRTRDVPHSVYDSGTLLTNVKDQGEDEKGEQDGGDEKDGAADRGKDTTDLIPNLPEIGTSGGFGTSSPSVASANEQIGAADGGSSGSSSALYVGVGAAIAAVALLVALALLVVRRRNNLARKYSLREIGGAGPYDDAEVTNDGVVIVDKSKSYRPTNSPSSSDGGTLPHELSGSFDQADDGAYQEVVELGLSESAATAAIAEKAVAASAAAASSARSADANKKSQRSRDSLTSSQHTQRSMEVPETKSVTKTRSENSGSTMETSNVGVSGGLAPIQQGTPTAPTPRSKDSDETSSVASEESGVTIELDMRSVNSTVSDITWAGPQSAHHALGAGAILNRFPPYKSLYAPKSADIMEEDEEEDEEDIFGGSHGGSQGGSANTASNFSRTSGRSGGNRSAGGRAPPQRYM